MSNEQDKIPRIKFSPSAKSDYERLADDLPREGFDALKSAIEDIARSPTEESEARLKPKVEIDEDTKAVFDELENSPILTFNYIETKLHDDTPFSSLDMVFEDRLLVVDSPEFPIHDLGLKPFREGQHVLKTDGEFTFSKLEQTEEGIIIKIKKEEDEIIIPAKYYTLSPSLKKIWGDDWRERAKQRSVSQQE